ncbi:pyridoxal-dependent decarboxylase [Methylotetracoccus oryzae]|uniref:pyridoxal-dependent decarboxylase n=1 Tax=Methylotetracoccus oryzae TaxID=1919059 RepID=UPI00111B4839|nr:pyridoxal-dependent decarboxylase [Methylotetracoccus oryzae]
MLTRRRFLGQSALGMLTLAGGCAPASLVRLKDRAPVVTTDARSLAVKARRTALRDRVLGYPINMLMPNDDFFAWRQQLQAVGIGRVAYNNVGNPFERSSMLYDTRDIEKRVILDFAPLYGFAPDDTWGFVSNSGTDSNMHGMYMGRTLLKARTGVLPKAYFTVEAHYSIQILQDLLGIERVLVGTRPDGSMDPADLQQKLAANADSPALVVPTLGTTFKGAIDPLDEIQAALQGHAAYVHLDAALFGGYLPYTRHAVELLRGGSSGIPARYDSIAVSCHKFFGFPAPAGLYLTTAASFEEFHRHFSRVHNPEYIRHVPGTITCSRDAVKPAEFHYFTTTGARAALTENANGILQRTGWLLDQLRTRLPQYRATRANELSNTVCFRQPSQALITKYSLATMRQSFDGKADECAHVVVMPHASEAILSEFLADLEADTRVPT